MKECVKEYTCPNERNMKEYAYHRERKYEKVYVFQRKYAIVYITQRKKYENFMYPKESMQ